MTTTGRYRGTARYIRVHWPAFVLLYGLILIGLILLGLGLIRTWYGLLVYGGVMLLAGAYLLAFRFRLAHRLHDPDGVRPVEAMFRMAQTRPDDDIVCVDLGLRTTAIQLARQLTTGKVHTIDVYNPESNTGSALHRGRKLAPRAAHDPRLAWLDGNIDLLPMPDNSVSAVYMNQILSEFWMGEEQSRLLLEVYRVLMPNGRLIVAERTRTRTNTMALGVESLALRPSAEWAMLLKRAGFQIKREEELEGLITLYRADKPSRTSGRQLALDLDLP